MPGENLLPCPFCGGKAELRQKGNDFTAKRFLTIKCIDCHAQMTNGAIRNSLEWLYGISVEKWNRRAIPVEESQHVNQQANHDICPACSGSGRNNGDIRDSDFCTRCDGTGKRS